MLITFFIDDDFQMDDKGGNDLGSEFDDCVSESDDSPPRKDPPSSSVTSDPSPGGDSSYQPSSAAWSQHSTRMQSYK